MSNSQIVQLGRYGLIGVMLALIGMSAYSQWVTWKISSNHIEHNTQALVEMTEALVELKGAVGELKEVIRK